MSQDKWEALEVYEQLKSILIESFFAKENSIAPEALLDEGLGLDSLEKVKLFNHLEVEFDVGFTDEEIDETQRIQELVDLIIGKLQSKELVLVA